MATKAQQKEFVKKLLARKLYIEYFMQESDLAKQKTIKKKIADIEKLISIDIKNHAKSKNQDLYSSLADWAIFKAKCIETCKKYGMNDNEIQAVNLPYAIGTERHSLFDSLNNGDFGEFQEMDNLESSIKQMDDSSIALEFLGRMAEVKAKRESFLSSSEFSQKNIKKQLDKSAMDALKFAYVATKQK